MGCLRALAGPHPEDVVGRLKDEADQFDGGINRILLWMQTHPLLDHRSDGEDVGGLHRSQPMASRCFGYLRDSKQTTRDNVSMESVQQKGPSESANKRM